MQSFIAGDSAFITKMGCRYEIAQKNIDHQFPLNLKSTMQWKICQRKN